MRNSALVKALTAAILTLALLIPLAMIRSLVSERQQRRETAIADVTDKWGAAQTLEGPVLTVPIRSVRPDKDGVPRVVMERLQLLPDRLKVEGKLDPSVRRRGIFEVVLYGLELSVSGAFPPFETKTLGVAPEDVLWSEAVLSVGLTDTRGIKSRLETTWDGAAVPFRPGPGGNPLFESGVHVPIALADGTAPHTFAFSLTLQGSESLFFTPVGVETLVSLKSPWPHPSFVGNFLPESRTVAPAGFSSTWRVSHFGRSYAQEWKLLTAEAPDVAARLKRSAFGVALYLPADNYQQSERALKYAVLFIVLTFGAFFLFEVFARLQLHALQYLLVGLALSLFYLLLLSISEPLGFGAAYAISATAIVLLVAGYCMAVLEKKTRGLTVGALLAGLYAYLYVLLRVEDYALLMGSVALFVILAAVMYATRRVDWWTVSTKPPAPPTPGVPPLPRVPPVMTTAR
jgi:inner membrane protein